MSEEGTQSPNQSPSLRGSDSDSNPFKGSSSNGIVDLSGAIPFMIDISKFNITNNDVSSVNVKEYHFLAFENPDEDDYPNWNMSGGTTMSPDYPSKEQKEAENEVRTTLFKDLDTENNWSPPKDAVYNAMLNSPMFQNNDGFTAMNDHGLSIKTTIDSRNPAATLDPKNFTAFGTDPVENFGIAAANDEAETTVDDFFPPPFIPFTM